MKFCCHLREESMNESLSSSNFSTGLSVYSWLGYAIVTPILVNFLWPLFALLLVYFVGLHFLFYYLLYGLNRPLTEDFWDLPRRVAARTFIAYGNLWHGHEIEGLEHIPVNSGALVIYYHGALPIDWYMVLSKTYLQTGKLMHSIGDDFLFRIPGFRPFLDGANVLRGTKEECVKILKEGNVLSLSPGGVREAQFGDNNYKLIWGSRRGFARVALEAKVPIIPAFTVNIREAVCSSSLAKSFFRKIYEATRLPLVPFYGNFPVKLRTIIGKPIPYDGTLTVEQLAEKAAKGIEDLIHCHQRLPGSIFSALMERLKEKTQKKTE